MTDWWATGTSIAGAAATVGAVGVALWVAIREGRQRDAERRDAEAGQARLVTCRMQLGKIGSRRGSCVIHNFSRHAVVDIELCSVTAVDPATGERWTTAETAGRRTWAEGEPLGPGLSYEFDLLNWVQEGSTEPKDDWMPRGGWHTARIKFVYRFTDAAGLRWERRNDEPPVRVLGDD
ncbi:hypothetical protein [Streptomyces tirandamycinicus]|uniref:Uncharacterized protein n=1 Tax=Streptomyces tirandamycinicus TaxID=2174846 RepID=A0A2S1T2B2_9ACTN|nr:hypothetical protein [Streptomyces tirandamycinicus]AWI32780.1 hypothetical protein DDW44_31200 [Streptomyces tirandamycinicus]